MKKFFMAFGMFAATYFLLCINLNGKPLFDHLHALTRPLTSKIQRGVETLMGKSYQGTREVGGQLFNNSLPQAASTRLPAKVAVPQKNSAPEESLSEAERSELNSLIKNYSR